MMTYYVDVALYYCFRLKGAPRWEFVEIQIVGEQSSHPDGRTGDKSGKSPTTRTENRLLKNVL
jgi:hypothetical protein